MGTQPVFESLPMLDVEWIAFTAESVQIGLVSKAPTCLCPCCCTSSSQVHGYSMRTLRDSPAHGRVVELRVTLRRFVCRCADCPRQTFAEQVPELMPRRGRMTCRLAAELRETALLLGGEAGGRLACKLHMPTSADTLLRLIRRQRPESIAAPRVLGVDDWAFRRGRHYGTILCDLESHKVVDLLPERSAEALAGWLAAHPGAEVISRDRGGEYAKGAALGAPQARQVADRFHLVQNLSEAFERGLDRRRDWFDEAAKASSLDVNGLMQQTQGADENAAAAATSRGVAPARATVKPQTKRQKRHEQSRSRRMALYRQVKELMARGLSLRAIARQLSLHPHTVKAYAQAGQFPEHGSLRSQKTRKHSPGRWRPSLRHAACLLLQGSAADPAKTSAERLEKQRLFFAALHQRWPELTQNIWMVQEFSRVLSQDDPAELEAWVALTNEPQIMQEIRRFAKNLDQDWKAVVEAVRQPWSNGQVEGQVNRLKTIKRQMYGRANFDLLRARVLQMN